MSWFDDNAPDRNIRARGYGAQATPTLSGGRTENDIPSDTGDGGVGGVPDMPRTGPGVNAEYAAILAGQPGVTASAASSGLQPANEPRYTEMPGSAAYRGPAATATPTAGTTASLIPKAQWTGAIMGNTPYDTTGVYVWDESVQSMRPKTGTARVWNAAANNWVTAGEPATVTPSGQTAAQTASTAAASSAAQVAANGNPTYWQNVPSVPNSLIQPWGTAFSYEAFQSPEPFVAGTLKTPGDTTPPKAGVPDWSTDPGFEFRLKEGQKALEKSAAAKGTLLNGGTLKSLNDYSQNVASDEYSRIYGRKYGEYTDTYNRNKADYTTGYNKALGEYQGAFNVFDANQLRQLNPNLAAMGMGQTSANQLGSTGLGYAQLNSQNSSGYANQYGNLTTQGANARASGIIGAGNAYTNYGNQLSDLASSYYGYKKNT